MTRKNTIERLLDEVMGRNVIPEPNDIDMDGVPNIEDCMPLDQSRDKKKWIEEAVGEEGRVREYLRRKYGIKAFKSDGDIKMSFLNKAIRYVKDGPGRNKDNLLQALYLAKRLKKM